MKRYLVTVAAFLLIIGALVGLWLSERNATDEKEAAKQDEAQAQETALAYEDSLEALCAGGYKAACAQLATLPDVKDDPDPDDPETQDIEVQEPEIQDPEIQDPETQDPEEQNREPDDEESQDPENQDPETQDPEEQNDEIQDPETQDPEIQNPEINDPDPNDPPVCEGEFVCQSELEAAIANFVTMAQVLAQINAALQPLGCEVNIANNQGPPLVLDCTITGKP